MNSSALFLRFIGQCSHSCSVLLVNSNFNILFKNISTTLWNWYRIAIAPPPSKKNSFVYYNDYPIICFLPIPMFYRVVVSDSTCNIECCKWYHWIWMSFFSRIIVTTVLIILWLQVQNEINTINTIIYYHNNIFIITTNYLLWSKDLFMFFITIKITNFK